MDQEILAPSAATRLILVIMAKLEILKFPDPRLRRKGHDVAEVTPELVQLAEDMLETMYAERGIGLAAAQVNRPERLIVMDLRTTNENGERVWPEDATELEKAAPMPLVVFNPVILKKKNRTTYDEGCLSVPGYYETVERAEVIELEGIGRDGKKFRLPADGLLAICIQHEIDHLEGKLFIDRLSPIKSNLIKAQIKKNGYPEREPVGTERL